MLIGANPALSAVTGEEALAATYPEFYKWYVQRKKQELIAPRFVGIGEVALPRSSLLHYFTKNVDDYGPPVSEAFISNFPDDVFIQFATQFTPIMGHGRTLPLEINKAIKTYRASHFVYNWTKDIATVYNKEKVLIVKNYGLINKMYAPRPSLFVNFESHYNRYHMLMNSINEEAARGNRKQFMRIDLPINMPGWNNLVQDYDHYIGSFKNGVPVPANNMVRETKAENSYWLLDMLAFLFGDYEYSQFGRLTPKAMQDLHIIFVANSRCLVIHLATLKTWLEELNEKRYMEKVATDLAKAHAEAEKTGKPFTPTHTSHRAGSPKRLNVSKRVYLAFLNMSRNGMTELEVVEEKQDAGGSGTNAAEAAQVADGSAEAEKGKGKGSNQDGKGKVLRPNESVPAAGTGGSLFDVLSDSKKPDSGPDEGPGESGNGDHPETIEDWTAEVDETLLEQEKVVAETSADKDSFPTIESGIAAALDERAREGVLTVPEQKFFMNKGEKYKSIRLENGQTLEQFIQIKPEELLSLKSDAEIKANLPAVLDKSMLRSRAKVLKQGYVDKFLHKDVVKMFLGIQNAGVAINDFRHEIINGVEGEYDVYVVQTHPVDGDQGTHHIRMPRVQSDSSFTVDGVKSHMQLQRMELPVRKISKHKVALTSYYDRKLMVSRSIKKVDDLGDWLVKQVVARGASKTNPLTFNRGSSFNPAYKAPRIYSILSSKFQWIKAGEYTLDFRIARLLEEHPEFKKYTKQDGFLIGVHEGKPLVVDDFGNVLLDGVEINSLEGLMSVNTSKAPMEYAVINISGYLFPMGVVLCYYFGIDKLLEIIGATTRSVPMGTRPKLGEDEYSIAFNDEYLIFNRREKLTTLIFGGMPKLNNISNFSRSNLNDKGVWVPLMGDKKVRPQQFAEMKLLYDMFIDPITKEELKRLGYAQSFNHLLIDAVKLLETDWARHEVELEEQRIVGYERFAGHLYREWVKAIRGYRNKGKGGRKHKIDFNPEAVTMNIITDTSVNLVEEVGPTHQLKDQEELTFGGVGGRGEISMVKRARVQLDSYRGVVSEANKDSGKVGFVTYTTSDPCILDYRGNIAIGEKPTLTGLMSVTGNLAFGMNRDDPKRGMFTSTQWSQAVSALNYTPNITRTGYDSVVAHRTSELYSKVAKENGVVTEVSDEALVVTYSDGTTDTYAMGLFIGEASGEYHRHTRITDLRVGEKFKAGDVIGWDYQWFDRDIFQPGQVVLKVGKMLRVALLEDQDTYEDSIALAKDIAQEYVTPYIKKNQFVVDISQILRWKVKVGDEVDYDSILCEVEEDHFGGGSADSDLAEDVNRLGIKQIRSNHHGKIVKIEVMYNGTSDQMSESLRKFIAAADKDRARRATLVGSSVKTGAVNNSLNVNKPILAPERAMVRIYVESMEASTTADKYVIGNQMKGTAGNIMEKPLMTLDGRVVHAKASFKGMFNRMVLSLRDKMASNELTYQVTQQGIRIYRGLE